MLEFIQAPEGEEEQALVSNPKPINGWPDRGPFNPRSEVGQDVWIKKLEDMHHKIHWENVEVQVANTKEENLPRKEGPLEEQEQLEEEVNPESQMSIVSQLN